MTAVDVVAFIRARLDEDEQVALAACGWRRYGESGEWTYDRDRFAVSDEQGRSIAAQKVWEIVGGVPRLDSLFDVDGTHIARHDPARVLREVEAMRRIVETYRDERVRRDIMQADDARAVEDEDQVIRRRSSAARCRGLEIAVQLLAEQWSDHPEYQENWKS